MFRIIFVLKDSQFSRYDKFVKVTVEQARNRLKQLIQAAVDGESVIITKDGCPVARLIPEQFTIGTRTLPYGCMREQLDHLGDSWSRSGDDVAIATLFTGFDETPVEY